MSTLFDEKAIRTRLRAVYRAMAHKARKPKLVKQGKRRGEVIDPGVELSFTFDQLWAKVWADIGPSASRCPYCEMIGCPANLITLANCVFDHQVPLARGGTWDLSNLVAVCEDCNNRKSKLSLEFYIALASAIERWPDPQDRAYILTSMKSTGVAQRLRGFHGKPKTTTLPPPAQTNRTLALQDDF